MCFLLYLYIIYNILNFYFRNPTPQKNEIINELWIPTTKEELHCLEIRNDLKMTKDLLSEKLAFMDSIISKYKH